MFLHSLLPAYFECSHSIFFPGLFSFSIDLQFKELADEFQEPMYFY